MKRGKRFSIILLLLIGIFGSASSQDRAVYITEQQSGKTELKFSMDFSKVRAPKSLDEFTQLAHLSPIRQDTTGTCWAFATISLLESELARKGKPMVKLSEMYIVYWEYIEKVRQFVQKQGNSFFGEGSQHNAVLRQMKSHGLVRASDYNGLLAGAISHNHNKLFRELKNYLNFLKENNIWDENQAIAYTKLILNKYLGEPPETIIVDGKPMTPLQYMSDVLGINPDDYVCFISLMEAPFYQQAEYKVPDNWWHSSDYYNIPLDEFYGAIVKAVQHGFTVALGGDTSEPGKSAEHDIAIIPSFDLPGQAIDQSAREFRFKNNSSTDDHAVHLVGYKKLGRDTWFLIKDSGGSAFRGKLKGYFMFRDDYVRLKMLNFMVHKDAVSDLLEKIYQNQASQQSR